MAQEFQDEFDLGQGTVIRVMWAKRLHKALEEYYEEFCPGRRKAPLHEKAGRKFEWRPGNFSNACSGRRAI